MFPKEGRFSFWYFFKVTIFNFRYNNAFARTRQHVERVIGHWKKKFHSLHAELRIDIENVPQYVIAAAVLHNICRMQNLPQFHDEVDQEPGLLPNHINTGEGIRNHIVNTYFTNQ